MAGVKVEIGVQALQRKLRRLQAAAVSPTSFWKDGGEYLLQSVEQRSEDENDPAGKQWKPLSPATLAPTGSTAASTRTPGLRPGGGVGLVTAVGVPEPAYLAAVVQLILVGATALDAQMLLPLVLNA